MTDKSAIGQDIPEVAPPGRDAVPPGRDSSPPGRGPGPAAGPAPTRTDLWNHDFRLFFTARTVAMFGDGMVPVALTAGLLGAGRPASSVGYALGAWMGPLAAFVLFGGVLADRFTPRRMMVIADALRLVGASVLAVSFLVLDGGPPLWEVYALSALSGVGAALFQPGVASTVPRIATDVQRANAVLGVSEALMGMAGPAFAGVVAGFWGAGAVFAANAATFGVSGVCLFLLKLRGGSASEVRRGGFFAELAGGWREFKARSWLWGVITIWTVYGLTVLGPATPLTAVLVTEGHGAGTYGALMAVNGAGSVAGGLLALRLRPARPLAAGALALLGVSVALLSLGLDLPVPALGAGQFAIGAAFAFWLVMWSTTVQTHVPPEALNRLHAYDVAGSLLMLAAGRALAGPVAEAVGAEKVLLVGAGLNVVAVAVLLAVPAIGRLRRM
ncbi:MFS transporter [Streptomyces sp. NPDC006530]|uniref:MFS transporter n=1 Tax=Streptomyces sp. NPDC006530 TaxID=3364750 RepID=UPI0036AC488B